MRDVAMIGTTQGPAAPRRVRKAVAYVVREGRLLVFTHDDMPLEVAGVQVPAGTIEPGEAPADAVVREVSEETGIRACVVRALGVEHYDVRPARNEVHERHFFQLEPAEAELPEQWVAGEQHPSGGGPARRWTCRWMPIEQAQVLCAGFGARLGALEPDREASIEGRRAETRSETDAAPDRISRERFVAFVRAAGMGVVATVDGDGHPEAALVGIAVSDDGELVFDSETAARKVRNIREHGRVAVVIGWDDDVSVQIEGNADVLAGGERAALGQLYLSQFPGSRALDDDFSLVRIVPDWLRWYDAGRHPAHIVEQDRW